VGARFPPIARRLNGLSPHPPLRPFLYVSLRLARFERPRTAHPSRTTFDTVSSCGVELCVSLQIAILKVLVSHPEGRATIAALNSDLCILNTSGPDWTNRLKRLAARIFGQRLVLRDTSGWQITPEGRAFLDWLESGAASANAPVAELSPPPPEQPPLLLVGVARRQRLTRRGRFGPRRRSA
jgi:hypothetical protein